MEANFKKILESISKGQNENKKEVQLLRSEFATVEHKTTEATNDILKEILEDIGNLEKDYKKLQQEDIHAMAHLKSQSQQLQTEKANL